MRRRGRTDGNQVEIVRALRAVGATVQSLADIGKGCPDLLVGFRGDTYLLEVKDGSKVPSARKLTEDEERWHKEWHGDNLHTVNSLEEALLAVGAAI